MASALPKSKIANQKSKIAALPPLLLDWFAREARDLPWRRTRDPYAIWVSEIMLQQTQVKTVIPYWERWLRELPDIAALAAAAPEKIHKLWEGLGYYTRVRNLQKAAREIVARHGGRFPETFDAVLALPGIGRYTAGAICSIAFNQPTPILDGNVIRVLTRLFGIQENPKDKATNAQLWTLSQALVTAAAADTPATSHFARLSSEALAKENRSSHLNQSLMELGALICTPRQPQCAHCPVARHCVARRTGRTASLPNLGPRAAATAREFAAFVLEYRGRFLVRQRPAGVVNAHLWEFPNVELLKPSLHSAARSALGFAPAAFQPLCTIRHSITRYRIALNAFTVNGISFPRQLQGRWLPLAELKQLSFPSAHRKILERLS